MSSPISRRCLLGLSALATGAVLSGVTARPAAAVPTPHVQPPAAPADPAIVTVTGWEREMGALTVAVGRTKGTAEASGIGRPDESDTVVISVSAPPGGWIAGAEYRFWSPTGISPAVNVQGSFVGPSRPAASPTKPATKPAKRGGLASTGV